MWFSRDAPKPPPWHINSPIPPLPHGFTMSNIHMSQTMEPKMQLGRKTLLNTPRPRVPFASPREMSLQQQLQPPQQQTQPWQAPEWQNTPQQRPEPSFGQWQQGAPLPSPILGMPHHWAQTPPMGQKHILPEQQRGMDQSCPWVATQPSEEQNDAIWHNLNPRDTNTSVYGEEDGYIMWWKAKDQMEGDRNRKETMRGAVNKGIVRPEIAKEQISSDTVALAKKLMDKVKRVEVVKQELGQLETEIAALKTEIAEAIERRESNTAEPGLSARKKSNEEYEVYLETLVDKLVLEDDSFASGGAYPGDQNLQVLQFNVENINEFCPGKQWQLKIPPK